MKLIRDAVFSVVNSIIVDVFQSAVVVVTSVALCVVFYVILRGLGVTVARIWIVVIVD